MVSLYSERNKNLIEILTLKYKIENLIFKLANFLAIPMYSKNSNIAELN